MLFYLEKEKELWTGCISYRWSRYSLHIGHRSAVFTFQNVDHIHIHTHTHSPMHPQLCVECLSYLWNSAREAIPSILPLCTLQVSDFFLPRDLAGHPFGPVSRTVCWWGRWGPFRRTGPGEGMRWSAVSGPFVGLFSSCRRRSERGPTHALGLEMAHARGETVEGDPGSPG